MSRGDRGRPESLTAIEVARRTASRASRENADELREEYLRLSPREQDRMRLIHEEVTEDVDFEFDPVFGPMARALMARYGEHEVLHLFHPDSVLATRVTWPLFAPEVSELVGHLGISTSAVEVEGLVQAWAVPQPRVIAGQRCFFYRHVLAVAHELTFRPREGWT